MCEYVACTVNATLFIQQIFGAARVHAFTRASGREGTRSTQQNSENVIQLHLARFVFAPWEGHPKLEEGEVFSEYTMNSALIVRDWELRLLAFQD